MASIKELLKADIEIRWKILIICKEVLKFSHYLTKPETVEEQNYIYRDRHLTFINWALWRLVVIEMAKLFSHAESQKFNIIKLIGKVRPQGSYRSLKFDESILAEWDLELLKHTDSVEEISRLRNKFYAHVDGDPFEGIETSLTISACIEMLEFATEVIRTLAGKYLKTDYIAQTLYYDSKNFNLVKILVEAEQQKRQQIVKETGMSYKELFGE